MKNFVIEKIKVTKEMLPDYWASTVRNRLSGGVGSIYDKFESAEELEKALLEANWEETSHPAVMPGCRVFKAALEGRLGIVEISNLPEGTMLTADDSKSTGKIAMTVEGIRGELVPETYLIIGKEEGQDVVFTFHPGEPLRPSIVEVSTIAHGDRVTMQEAKELGFDYAKIV